jgi:hypothetical protein
MSRKISVSLTDQEAGYLDKLVAVIQPRSVSALIGRFIAENYVEVFPAKPAQYTEDNRQEWERRQAEEVAR